MVSSILWLRGNLRIDDNPALRSAMDQGCPVIPLFIWDPDGDQPWARGAASRWWLHQSLMALDNSLRSRGSRLILRPGPILPTLLALCRETQATSIHFDRRWEPTIQHRDGDLIAQLAQAGIAAETWNSSLLFEPALILNQQGRPFQVFSAFWRACRAKADPPDPLPLPRELRSPSEWPASLDLQDLSLQPAINWTTGMQKEWKPGEQGAAARLQRLLQDKVDSYDENRDLPGDLGTSRLSPHLAFGEIGPRQIWHTVRTVPQDHETPASHQSRQAFLRQLGWREFASYLLFHFPHTDAQPLRPEFATLPWRDDPHALRAWQRGETGYPIVDAGMRELWSLGWMHNRVRMIVASFLVKDLFISWQAGAAWFWDTLVDADLANNTLGWQWVAGCGADAAPYFRIFNPVLQGRRFDPDGAYVCRWVPELAGLPSRWIQEPWAAPPSVLDAAKVKLGRTYPQPLVDHAMARRRALEALASLKMNGGNSVTRANDHR